MVFYKSKFLGKRIDELLTRIENGDLDINIDTELSSTSSNAIANSTATKALSEKVDKVEGKGLSANDFTDDEKEKVAKVDSIKEATKQNAEALNAKANTDGYYPKMSVGFADNLIGRGEATAEEFTYRPANGKDPIENEVARVTKIKGNSVMWNQLCDFANDNFSFGSGSGVKDADGYTITISNLNDKTIFQFSKPIQFNSHIWLALATVESPIHVNIKGMTTQGFVANTKCTIYAIYKSGDNNWYWGLSSLDEGTTAKIKVYGYELYDLTKMFGAGNEPTTVEEFYARIPSGIDIDAYNEGEIINLNTEAIKTVGFNQWDEQWELGYIKADGTNGGYVANYIRSKNFIPVIGGMRYYLNRPANTDDCQIFCYDKSKNFISHYSGGIEYSSQIPLNVAYVRFYMNYGSEVYQNDICYNLSHTGYKNGTYEPYKEFTREIPVIRKYFPDGMKKAGNAFDSIEWDSSKQKWVAVQRIGVVDLGDLYWEMFDATTGRNALFYADIQGRKNGEYEILCAKYITKSYIGLESDKAVLGNSGANNIYIVDTDYTNATEFKSAMQGVMLYYELAEPIVTEIEEDNLNFDYDAEDFGTEEALSSIPSAPFSADIIYKFNAVDSIRQNRLDIKALQDLVLSLQSQISAMQTAQVDIEE